MNKGIQQKLFNYFQQEHGIVLLDGDYNEIEHILKSKPSSVLTDEEIQKAANEYAIERHSNDEAWQPDRCETIDGFIQGVIFARGTVASLEDMINLLREVYQRMLIDIDENGEPKSSIKELIIMWEKVDKYLVESKQTDVLQQVKPEIKERRNYERKC